MAAEVSRWVEATVDDVWAVLADGWTYGAWVVGASRVREVDDGYPRPGTRIHHSVGVWPLVLDDTSHVLEREAPHHLRLEARGWPFGQATIDITLAAEGDGCRVTMVEDASQGPGRLVPSLLRQALLVPRNRESLERLAHLAEGAPRVGR